MQQSRIITPRSWCGYLNKAIPTIALLICLITMCSAATTASSLSPSYPSAAQTVHSNAQLVTPASGRIWNLQDADLLSVINAVSQETGKNFVVDPRVNGKITLISSKPIRRQDLYQVFLSALSLLGYAAIPSGNVIKILPSMESNEIATHIASTRTPGKGEDVVLRVIPLENIPALQIMPVLRPLLPSWSVMSAYPPGNILIILGRAANLDRLLAIIHQVDQASNNEIDIIPLHHASAAQVATVLNNLENASHATTELPGPSIASDERSNAILLGGPKHLRLRMRVLIAELDAPSGSTGNTEVIYLRYLEAKTLAPLLSKLVQNMLTNHGHPQPIGFISTALHLKEDKPADTEPTNILAETNTNALIITASPGLMQTLKTVIAKLDIRPAQVLVEAILAEIDESNVANLGIQWGSVSPSGELSTGGNITDFPSLGAGIVGIIPHVQLRAVLSLLRNQNGVDILSTPSIMVLDNQKATIEVGQDVPYQTGSYATQSPNVTSATPFTTNSYKAVTLKLDVTPQINLSHSVRLKLSIKNDTLQNPANPGLTPIIKTSKIDNTVIVNSEDILVLGGLISRSNNDTLNKVPLLGDIPGLGQLFQQKIHNQEKKNLMVFLKPIIIQNCDNGMDITEMKYHAIRRAQANFYDDLATLGHKPLHVFTATITT